MIVLLTPWSHFAQPSPSHPTHRRQHPTFSAGGPAVNHKGVRSPSLMWHPHLAALGPSKIYLGPSAPAQVPGVEHWGKASREEGAAVVKWRVPVEITLGLAVQVDKLVRWAQDPASLGRRPHGGETPSVKYGSFFFPFSSTSVRALSLSFSPLPLPSSPSVASVVLALGVAWQSQGRVGVFATAR